MLSPAICAGEGCDARGWPMHRVHNKKRFLNLCTSCVLKSHPGAFCTFCFSLLSGSPPPATIAHCSDCQVTSHLKCLPNPKLTTQFVCPKCKCGNSPRFRYFSFEGKLVGNEVIKGLYAAEKLAGESVKREVERLKRNAEVKAERAVEGRKRARQWLEASMDLYRKEVDKRVKYEAAFVPRSRMRNQHMKWMQLYDMVPNHGDGAAGLYRLTNLGGRRGSGPNGVLRHVQREVVGPRMSQSTPQAQDSVDHRLDQPTTDDYGLEEEKKVISEDPSSA